MGSKIEDALIRVISNALQEINEILGYEYFEKNKIAEISPRFLAFFPYMLQTLKKQRGITLQDLEKEELDFEKGKKAVIKGIFHGLILKDSEGTSFEQKFSNYLYSSGTKEGTWMSTTDYQIYYKTVYQIVSKIVHDTNMIKFIIDFTKKKIYPTSQGFARIVSNMNFFENSTTINELVIDQHLLIFKELTPIQENYLKLLYGIRRGYTTAENMKHLENTDFFTVWKELKTDNECVIFTRSVPNTICWNAIKHDGFTKKINLQEVQFVSREGDFRLSYVDFISLVRDAYATTLALTKINLMIMLQTKAFW